MPNYLSLCTDERCHRAQGWRGKDEVMTRGRTAKPSVNTSRGAKRRGSPPSPGGSQRAASCRAPGSGGGRQNEHLDSQREVVL